jgi:CubicO group peptidase (beta-lactamase class C family)
MLRAVLAITLAFRVVAAGEYFPAPDGKGGWQQTKDARDALARTGVDTRKLDRALDWVKLTTKHGGLLVARNGWLVYERYFGRGHRDATPNSGSVGKSFTSIAAGILVHERRDLFPHGLDEKVFKPKFFPRAMFPLPDDRRADIKLGHLLAMTAGIRGNNPGYVKGKPVMLDPAGPDGWQAMVDEMAFGKQDAPLNTKTLWCEPGRGYSYATSSPHLVSIIIRHVTGEELEQFVRRTIAAPLGWGHWGWGCRNRLQHTAGGGGIALRATDMLRFAYMLLRKGRWGNRQVVPAAYVERCARSSPYNPHFPYSLQFNVNDTGKFPDLPRDLYWKTGSGGHAIFVVPSLDLVVFKMGGRDEQFDPANTGVPLHPGFQYDKSREGWKLGTDTANDEAYAETLRRVIAAIRK